MKRIRRALLAFSLMSLSMAAEAGPDFSGCVTPEGRHLYGDATALDQCKGAPVQGFNRDGSEGPRIPSPRTPEERKHKDEMDRKVAECNMQNRDQKRNDDLLLDRYAHEEDLQDARYDALGEQMRRVNEANEGMKDFIAKGKDLNEQARFFAAPHRMPADLQTRREANDQLERSQIRIIKNAAHEIERVNDFYDKQLKRYREIVNGTAKMPCDMKE